MPKYMALLVPETHWDREWYLTFQQFRISLVRLMDKLLNILANNPEYASFTLDGQTIALEDYLNVRPERREEIEKLVKSDRLLIGPWYVLADEFLVSGEATIRNLMLGHAIAEKFGKVMKVGYVPDAFGHISQLPQILQGFGISSAIFTRGLGDEADHLNTEFWWESPDGSRVLAINQKNSYCNACNLGVTLGVEGVDLAVALAKVRKEIESLSAKASTLYLLLNNGCDHTEPQSELPEIIKYVNEHLEDAEVVHSTFAELVTRITEAAPELGVLRGELRGAKLQALLPGVLSSRMHLKQENQSSQTLLEKWAEPAAAFAWINGAPYDASLIWLAWKKLLQNHPHDSICGCSIDQVHREMLTRFAESNQIGEEVTKTSLSRIADSVDTISTSVSAESKPIVVFNPHAWTATETVRVRMDKHLKEGELLPSYTVKSADGNAVPTQVSNEFVQDLGRQRILWQGDVCFTAAGLPPLGYKTYYIEPGKTHVATPLKADSVAIQNDFVKVMVRGNGTFDVVNKLTKTAYHNLNMLEDTEDVGDEYNYGRARSSRTITTEGVKGTLNVTEHGPVFATIRADFVLTLPVAATKDRLSRQEGTVECPVIVNITIHAHSPRVDIVTVFHNNASDHRLRSHFPNGVANSPSVAEGQFDVIERPVRPPTGDDWVEQPVARHPVQSFVAIDETDGGLAVLNQGLPEYEIVEGEALTIAQTLLRCVGWLSRDDFGEVPVDAGPSVPTPEAQCRGKHIFKYSVVPYIGAWKRAKIWQYAHQFLAPPRVAFTNVHPGTLAKSGSFLSVSPENIIVTAVKKAERADALVVRLFNTTPDEVEATIPIPAGFKSAQFVNLNEELIGRAKSDHGSIRIRMPGFRIQTVMFLR